MNRALLAALLAGAAAIALVAVLRPAADDLAGGGSAPATTAASTSARGPVPASAPPPTAPEPAPSEHAAPEARVALSSAQGTPEALGDALRAARAGTDGAARQAGAWQAWKEYLVLTRRDGSESLCRRVLDELVAAHRAEDDADARRTILRAVHPTGTDEVLALLVETARAGRTEADRLEAIRLLGHYGADDATTALQQTHPARPTVEATRALLERLRTRAATQLGELRAGASSDAERAALDAALRALAR